MNFQDQLDALFVEAQEIPEPYRLNGELHQQELFNKRGDAPLDRCVPYGYFSYLHKNT